MEIVIGYNENNRVNFIHKHATLFFYFMKKERKDKKTWKKSKEILKLR